MTSLLNLTPYPRKTFPRHFLNSVHLEIGFTGTSVQAILAAEAPLKEYFAAKGFVACRQVMQGQFSFQTIPDKPPTITQHSNPLGLQFSSQQPRRELQLLDTKFIFSDFAYEGFSQLQRFIKDVLADISKYVAIPQVNKVGFRKINSIVIDPVLSYQEALVIFNPVLFSNVKSGLIPLESLRAHEEVSVVERGSSACVMRARLNKLPKPNTYEANLDFDFVDNRVGNVDSALDETLPALNNEHFNLFMWAASPELIKLMETMS